MRRIVGLSEATRSGGSLLHLHADCSLAYTSDDGRFPPVAIPFHLNPRLARSLERFGLISKHFAFRVRTQERSIRTKEHAIGAPASPSDSAVVLELPREQRATFQRIRQCEQPAFCELFEQCLLPAGADLCCPHRSCQRATGAPLASSAASLTTLSSTG